jgi:hypothetical protein
MSSPKLLSTDDEVDPMVYAVNMVDCMLVLAVGFLIFTLMSFGMQSVVFQRCFSPGETGNYASSAEDCSGPDGAGT